MGQCVGHFIWSAASVSALHQPARIQPPVAATLWLRLHAFIFTPFLPWTLCVPVAHLSCSAFRGLLLIFSVDILTLELLFCRSTYCTFLECPEDHLFQRVIMGWIKDDAPLPQPRRLFNSFLLFCAFHPVM